MPHTSPATRAPSRAASRSSRRRVVVTALLAGTLLGAAACAAPATPVPAATVTRGPVVEVPKGAPPTPVVVPRWPLTGLPAEEAPTRPALAVKIENSREARPQTGLDQADLVWEEVVEGGITRYLAVFHSQAPAEIGPIRSVRPMDPAIAAPLHGLMVFSGGQAPFVQALRDAGLQIISNDLGDDGFYRKTGVGPAPHNVYGTAARFWDQADGVHSDPPPAQLAVARSADRATAVTAGRPATVLDVRMSGYSHPVWSWDAGTGTWLRSEGDSPAVVRSGARLAATNVVVLRVRLVDSGTVDPAGNPVPETVLEGTGQGVVLSGGQAVDVGWSKGAVDEPVTLTTADGAPVTLAPGTTWVELVPDSGSVTVG